MAELAGTELAGVELTGAGLADGEAAGVPPVPVNVLFEAPVDWGTLIVPKQRAFQRPAMRRQGNGQA